MADILERRGELTSKELEALQEMNKEQLIQEIIGLNRNWYGLFCALELMHSEDMSALEKISRKQLSLLRNSLESLDYDTTELAQQLKNAENTLESMREI